MKLILGKLNASSIVNYWKIEEDIIKTFNLNNEENFENLVGNYAIVENINDYDLVKIVGVVSTEEKYEKFLIGKTISKRVVNLMGRSMIRND